ncbi:MAG: hypothetical protein KJ058_11380 [Thermoanaerobaculia bacterium]|nr:hypothetical protein [Thermoanaerobaculia bacterium]
MIASPGWTTAAGLLLYGLDRDASPKGRERRPGVVRGVFERFRDVFTDLL